MLREQLKKQDDQNTTRLHRHLCCTRQKMQLVVMAAVLTLAGAQQRCGFGCQLTDVPIDVLSCGRVVSVYSTICSGQCYHKEPVYMGSADRPVQQVCSGDWSYEVRHIEGCSEDVTIPVAKSCQCTECIEDSTDCEDYHGNKNSCMFSF